MALGYARLGKSNSLVGEDYGVLVTADLPLVLQLRLTSDHSLFNEDTLVVMSLDDCTVSWHHIPTIQVDNVANSQKGELDLGLVAVAEHIAEHALIDLSRLIAHT